MGYAHGRRWSEEDIEKEIRKVANTLNIKRMPSKSEIESLMGNSSLTNKIAKSGGHYMWAKRLGLEVKKSESKTGIDHENIAMELLKTQGFKVESMDLRHPYDILVNDLVKIDVKVSNPGYYTGSKVHTFRLCKKHATCDFYMAIALSETKDIEKILIVPGHKARTTMLCVGRESKYDVYKERYDLIAKYGDMVKSII